MSLSPFFFGDRLRGIRWFLVSFLFIVYHKNIFPSIAVVQINKPAEPQGPAGFALSVYFCRGSSLQRIAGHAEEEAQL